MDGPAHARPARGHVLVTASAELAPIPSGADATRIECHLIRADTAAFDLYKASGNANLVNDQTVDVSWALTLPAPTTMTLSCAVGAVKFGAANARITALQVGSLTETVA